MKRLVDLIRESGEYMYHGTSHERLWDIKDSGHLRTHGPSHGTDQSTWPDGSRKKRSYWSHHENGVEPFFPEDGKPRVLRVQKHQYGFKVERGTGDHYLEHPVKAHHLEVRQQDGSWKPLADHED